ncbi:glycoside hydrolase family 16 protein [Curtobacterium sp. 9128]|uniref:glycoside hydrolase family 16 protein n=1 Tax=Curtobacterium sp. 9128 TaxID=1793722 RepID=UPI0021B4A4A0|nr:glycoside hydrolase family 16 protein [Curtobacterium sp. 9128]
MAQHPVRAVTRPRAPPEEPVIATRTPRPTSFRRQTNRLARQLDRPARSTTPTKAVLAAATAAALVLGMPTAASARSWWDGYGHRHHVTPTPTPTPSDDATPTDPDAGAPSDDQAPSDDPAAAGAIPDASFVEDFATAVPTGLVAAAYPDAWQPYPDGTSGIYAPSRTVSVHDGVMDVALGGDGTAGTFGSATNAWGHVGGSFSVRAKATGGDGNGAAFMLWPTSGTWSDGEIDFPEGNFEDSPSAFQHSMTPGDEASRVQIGSGVSWRDWHTYTVDWVPGQSVTYSVDGKVLDTETHDVPTTPHRYMFQVGNWGSSGHLLIDWVSTTE